DYFADCWHIDTLYMYTIATYELTNSIMINILSLKIFRYFSPQYCFAAARYRAKDQKNRRVGNIPTGQATHIGIRIFSIESIVLIHSALVVYDPTCRRPSLFSMFAYGLVSKQILFNTRNSGELYCL